MTLIKKLCLLFNVFFLVFAVKITKIEAGCLRCPTQDYGSVIACEGDTKFEVISKCGEPDYVEESEEIVAAEPNSKTDKTGKELKVVTVKIEKLSYNCGEGQFIKILVFRDGNLVSVENGDRGSGKQKCW